MIIPMLYESSYIMVYGVHGCWPVPGSRGGGGDNEVKYGDNPRFDEGHLWHVRVQGIYN